MRVPRQVTLRWPQEAFAAAVRKLFPSEWTVGFAMPMVEDLINYPPFDSYVEFMEDAGLEADGPGGPQLLSSVPRGWKRAMEGEQKGHFFASGGVPQMIPLNLQPQEHFEAAKEWCKTAVFPLDQMPAYEADLAYAASFTMQAGSLAHARNSVYKPVCALVQRMQPLTLSLIHI